MVMVTVSILFVVLQSLIPPIRQLTETLPLLLIDLLGVTITVLLMTYLIMPSATRLLKPWLYMKKLTRIVDHSSSYTLLIRLMFERPLDMPG